MTKLVNITLEDRIEIPSKRKFTPAGQMIVPAVFARTGPMNYLATTLQIQDAEEGAVVPVFRDEVEVFDEDSIQSFRSSPVTLGHPKDEAGNKIQVSSKNAKEFQVGTLEGLPVRDEDTLAGTVIIARQDAIDAIEGGSVELSAGYTCDIHVDEEGKYWQKNIKANHIAIVTKGRAGSNMRLADEDELTTDASKADASETNGKGNKIIVSDDQKKTEDAKSSGDNKPKNNGGGKIEKSKQVTMDNADLGNTDVKVIEAAIAAGAKVTTKTVAVGDVSETTTTIVSTDEVIADSSIAEEAIEKAEAHTVYLKAQDTADSAWTVYMAACTRLNIAEDNMYDADDIPVQVKAKSFDGLQAKLDAANESLTKMTDELEDSVDARVEVITIARDLTTLDEFKGKSISEIQKMVIVDQLPDLDLTIAGRGEDYIKARFDILTEDSGSGNSQMSTILADDVNSGNKPVVHVDQVAVARQNMIARNKA